MNNFNFWLILCILAIVLLIVYFKKKNSVWGGLTLGIILGTVLSIILTFRGEIFSFYIIIKVGIVGTLLWYLAELLGKMSDKMKKK